MGIPVSWLRRFARRRDAPISRSTIISKEPPVSGPARSDSAPDLQPDRDAVLAVMEEQLDDLLATAHAQQATISDLQRRVAALEQRSESPTSDP